MKWTAMLGLLLLSVGCGQPAPAESSAPTAPAAESVGSEAPEEVEAEAAPEEDAKQPDSGPAKLTVVAKVGNDSAAARVKVMGSDGKLLAEGKAGEPLAVQSGELEVEATITDPKALIDKPTLRESVSVSPGEDATHKLSFARCQVRVLVSVKGKPDPTATVTLSRDGNTIVTLTSGAEAYVAISPGRYSASVKSKRAAVAVSDIVLNDGATQTIPINAN